MPRVIAIIDTNVYRGQPDRVIDDLQWLEGRSGVRAMTSFHATTELLSHVHSVTDSSYGASRAALKRLWRHCAVYSLSDSGLPFAADPNGILAKTLFSRRAHWGDELAIQTASLVKRIALQPDDGALEPHLLHDLTVVRRFRDDAESRFATMLAETRRQLGLDKNVSSDFAPSARPTPRDFLQSGMLRSIAAYALVTNCASELGLRPSHSDIAQRASALEPHIPTALAAFESAIHRVVAAGAAPENCVNSLWDFHLALFAAESMRIDGHPVIVVTEDKPVRRAAATTGASSRVLSVDPYRAFLLARAAA